MGCISVIVVPFEAVLLVRSVTMYGPVEGYQRAVSFCPLRMGSSFSCRAPIWLWLCRVVVMGEVPRLCDPNQSLCRIVECYGLGENVLGWDME